MNKLVVFYLALLGLDRKGLNSYVFSQIVEEYSCSTKSCGISNGYSDVNPAIRNSPEGVVQVAFAMVDSSGKVTFDPTASLSQLGKSASISLGGATQNPWYIFNYIDSVVSQFVTIVKENKVNKVDIDLENLKGISQDLMIEFLTKLHDALPGVRIQVAPECPGLYPSAEAPSADNIYGWWKPVLNQCSWLYVFIQTYNNWCSTYPEDSVENLVTIVDYSINQNGTNPYYYPYNASQIIMGLCARDNDPSACDTGYVAPENVEKFFEYSIRTYNCTVGCGVWDSYGDRKNGYAITNACINIFEESCPSTIPDFKDDDDDNKETFFDDPLSFWGVVSGGALLLGVAGCCLYSRKKGESVDERSSRDSHGRPSSNGVSLEEPLNP